MPSKLAALTAAFVAALIAAAAPAAAATTLANWDKSQQAQVVRAGLMQQLPDGFEGDHPLTSSDLSQAFTALSARTGVPAVTVSAAPISVTRFDALAINQLGLS